MKRFSRGAAFAAVLSAGLFPYAAEGAEAAAAPQRLLPAPQEIRFGRGNLPVRGLAISIQSTSSPEDRFAAEELPAWLSEASGRAVEIVAEALRTGAILFRRTGAVDPLPVPGEAAGPGSRESYEIRIASDGAMITARSSAGLYGAAQTLRQMVEGRGAEAILPDHIDVVPNLELYGHLHDLFRLERYADLAVLPHGGEFNRENPRIKPLLEDWIGQLARLFPGPFSMSASMRLGSSGGRPPGSKPSRGIFTSASWRTSRRSSRVMASGRWPTPT